MAANRGEAMTTERLILGCMQFGSGWVEGAENTEVRQRARAAVETALGLGITRFDHADIYCRGRSEEVFSRALQDLGVRREQVSLQSKCGMIYAGVDDGSLGRQYDLSRDHILRAVEGTLRRLGTDHLDLLLLHRPDVLAEPEEIARAFDWLESTGAVRRFGVSNHNPAQIDLLRHRLRQPLAANQVQISLLETSLFDAGLVADSRPPAPASAEAGVIEYCRLHAVELQAWAPLARGMIAGGSTPSNPRVERVRRAVGEVGAELGVAGETVAVAWLLRHPAGLCPVIGTRDPARIKACAAALEVNLTREQWYRLYLASRGQNLH
jgi:predicted oxidoreductase